MRRWEGQEGGRGRKMEDRGWRVEDGWREEGGWKMRGQSACRKDRFRCHSIVACCSDPRAECRAMAPTADQLKRDPNAECPSRAPWGRFSNLPVTARSLG